MDTEQFREGSRKVQLALGGLLVIAAVLFLFVQSVISDALVTIQELSGQDPLLAAKMAGRVLLWIVFSSSSIAIAISLYVFSLASKVSKDGIYPPQDFPVAVRTRIVSGSACIPLVRKFRFLAALLLFYPLVGLAIWYSVTGGYW